VRCIGPKLDELISLGLGRPLPSAGQVPVHELVARWARTDPVRIAIHSGGEAVSYGALDAWAGRIAARLLGAGVRRGNHVGVLVEPSAAMIAAVLGIVRCGAAYVALDPTQSDERIADVLIDARTAAVVADGDTQIRLPEVAPPVVQAGNAIDLIAPVVPVTAEATAYLSYTSRSTGEPKGVIVEHGQLAASMAARRHIYPGAPVFLLVPPLASESSAAGLWGTLTAGGSLVVAPPGTIRDGEPPVELIERHQVTQLMCQPGQYACLLEEAARIGGHPLRSLQTVITVGAPLPETLVQRHFTLHAETVALVREYGPAEATGWASYHRFEGPGPISIGRPVPGVRLYVLDDRLRPVPRGEEGELFIGGAGVSRGYFGRPEATGRTFCADRFAEVSGARMCRTGDRVRWTDTGMLNLIGGNADRGPLCTAPDHGQPEAERNDLTPDGNGGPIAQVTAAWAEILKLSDVPVDADFFDLGGHSFSVFQLQDALEKHTGTRPPVLALFQHATVCSQAALIRDRDQQLRLVSDCLRAELQDPTRTTQRKQATRAHN
jgi:amino acid adenylation domain-containing protein